MNMPKLTRKHILRAIRKIDANGVPPRRGWRYYYPSFEGRSYPAKYVISLATRFASGHELLPNDFHTNEAQECLKKLGFEIKKVKKTA
ncbi:MAG: hypothetical protein GYA46_01965 [candidate division Zixibacteria bacterium]|nr:hypothetical protein [candidate division Zixibacteria bacterium]